MLSLFRRLSVSPTFRLFSLFLSQKISPSSYCLKINYNLIITIEFCGLLLIFANGLDPEQAGTLMCSCKNVVKKLSL